MKRHGTKEFEVSREAEQVVIRLNEDAAAGLALILDQQPRYGRAGMLGEIPSVEWGDMAADIRTAPRRP